MQITDYKDIKKDTIYWICRLWDLKPSQGIHNAATDKFTILNAQGKETRRSLVRYKLLNGEYFYIQIFTKQKECIDFWNNAITNKVRELTQDIENYKALRI